MDKNRVRADTLTHCLLFQKNTAIGDIARANVALKNVLRDTSIAQYAQIDVDALEQYFELSLSLDNFEGLAQLIIYLERNDVDISSWKMSRFRSALDFYLNYTFDLNKVLTFTRFYTHFGNCSLRNVQSGALDTLSDKELALVHNQIFGELESLVDMNTLFGYVVEKVGRKQLVEPVSRVNPVQNLIEFFSQPEIR